MTIEDLELLYSARDRATYRALVEALRGMPRAPVDDDAVVRALEVQAMLAERSQHRAVPLPDLVVAACAERADLAVLHYDADFERIAQLTGQAAQWIVPRGSRSVRLTRALIRSPLAQVEQSRPVPLRAVALEQCVSIADHVHRHA